MTPRTTSTSQPLAIVATGLVKRFGGFVAVDHVDFTLQGSGITALIGPNGAGKSTLFNLICGQLRPDEGTVMIGDTDVTKRRASDIAQYGVARGFQDVRLFNEMTVLENVRVYAQSQQTDSLLRGALMVISGSRESRRSRDRALEWLDYLSIARFANVEARELGFAEQKLVALARLLALEPSVLMLDEPASGLDPDGRDRLMTAVKKVADDGHTVCFVEHNTEIVRAIADRVVFIAQGKILADGEPEEVFSHSTLAEAYLGLA